MHIQATSNLHHPVQTTTKLDRSCFLRRFDPLYEKTAECHAEQEPVFYRPLARTSEKPSDLIVVLDMDQTLIDSIFYKDLQEIPVVPGIESLRFRAACGNTVHTRLRPGLRDFLRNLASRFEVHIFTAGTQGYADPLLDALEDGEPGKYFHKRWYRHDCTCLGGRDRFKDLTKISFNLSRVVLVDDVRANFRGQPENGILIDAFRGTLDTASPVPLVQLWKDLLILDSLPDVRPHIRSKYNHAKHLNPLVNDSDDDSDDDTEWEVEGVVPDWLKLNKTEEKQVLSTIQNDWDKDDETYAQDYECEIQKEMEPLPDDEDCDLDDEECRSRRGVCRCLVAALARLRNGA